MAIAHMTLWVRWAKKGCIRLAAASDKVYQLLAHGQWFSPGTLASSTTKTGRHDIAEILLKVALNTINQIKSNQFWRRKKFDIQFTIKLIWPLQMFLLAMWFPWWTLVVLILLFLFLGTFRPLNLMILFFSHHWLFSINRTKQNKLSLRYQFFPQNVIQ